MQGKFDVGLDVAPSASIGDHEPRRGGGQGRIPRTWERLPYGVRPPGVFGISLDQCRLVAATGMGGQRLADILGGRFINEVIAQGRGTIICPQARTIIDMGAKTPR